MRSTCNQYIKQLFWQSYYRIDPNFCPLIIALCPLTMSAFSSRAQNPSKVTDEKVRRHHSILISKYIQEFEIISEPEIALHLNTNLFYQDPCTAERNASMKCLSKNNYDNAACVLYFENYKKCKNFWHDVQTARRKAGLYPYLPPHSERDAIKTKFLTTGKIPTSEQL